MNNVPASVDSAVIYIQVGCSNCHKEFMIIKSVCVSSKSSSEVVTCPYCKAPHYVPDVESYQVRELKKELDRVLTHNKKALSTLDSYKSGYDQLSKKYTKLVNSTKTKHNRRSTDFKVVK